MIDKPMINDGNHQRPLVGFKSIPLKKIIEMGQSPLEKLDDEDWELPRIMERVLKPVKK